MHDVMMAPDLLSTAGPIRRLIADKAYDTNQLRNLLVQLDIDAVIPSIARRKPLIPHDREAYRQRNLKSSACLLGSRTSAASQHATTNSQQTSLLASSLPRS
jgi:hypothetical protein